MKCREVVEILEQLAPRRFACEWDNPGLLAGRLEREVQTILLTVDVDDRTVKRAVETGTDMIVSHHPLIFKAIRHVTDEDFIGRRLLSMIQADISCFAMHTNFDAAPGCMADLAAARLGMKDTVPLEVMGTEGESPYGIGRFGILSVPEKGGDLARRVKKEFGLPFVAVYGGEQWETEKLWRVAVCPGSGGSMIPAALSLGAQALITGDISHHEGIDAAAQGLMVLDAGHYGLEYIFMDYVEAYLKQELPASIHVEKMPVVFPAALI